MLVKITNTLYLDPTDIVSIELNTAYDQFGVNVIEIKKKDGSEFTIKTKSASEQGAQLEFTNIVTNIINGQLWHEKRTIQ